MMENWYIMVGALICGAVLLLWLAANYILNSAFDMFCAVFVMVTILIGLVAGVLTVFERVAVPLEINSFEQQKAYIEERVEVEPLERVALEHKRIELNAWLYQSQYKAEHWRGWTIYPERVLDLKPIQ
jgi:hypothetical protein